MTTSVLQPRPRRADAMRDKLFRAGAVVVARRGYTAASVARITEEAGISQGSFYSYFPSRQDFFEQLLPEVGRMMLDFIAEHVRGSLSFLDVERRGLRSLFAFLDANPSFMRVLDEAAAAVPAAWQQHAVNVEGRYVRALERGARSGELRSFPADEVHPIAVALIGARYYLIRRHIPDARLTPSGARAYQRFVRYGLRESADSGKPAPLEPVAAEAAQREPPARRRTRGAVTRAALLDAGVEIVGRSGFERATIADIVEAAGVATGTFYLHFTSRQALFDQLLDHVRERMIAAVFAPVGALGSFVDFEIATFARLCAFSAENPAYLRIEHEGKLWTPEAYVRHVQAVAHAYAKALRLSLRAGGGALSWTPGELEAMVSIIVGIRQFLAARFAQDDGLLPPHVIAAWNGLIARGLYGDDVMSP